MADLPTDVDEEFADDPNDPTVKLHQQWHSLTNRHLNYFDLATRAPNVGDGLVFDGTHFVPQSILAVQAALPTQRAYLVYDPTKGYVFDTTAPSSGSGGTTTPGTGTGGGTTTPGTGTGGGTTTPSKPSAPTNVVATAVSSSEVDVRWTPSTSNTVVGQRLFINGKQVGGDLSATANTYAWTAASPNTAYTAEVLAFTATASVVSDKATAAAVTTPAGPATYDSNGLSSTGPTLSKSQFSSTDSITASATITYDPTRSTQQTFDILGIDCREVDPSTKAVISTDDNHLDFAPAAAAQSTSGWTIHQLALSGSTTLPGGTTAAPKMYRAQVFYKITGAGAYPRVGPPVYFTVVAAGTSTSPTPAPGGTSSSGAGARGVLPATPSTGWFSGGDGEQIDRNSTGFGNWRGRPIEVLGHWADGTDGGYWDWSGLKSGGPAYNFKGMLDLAIGGPSTANYAAAAGGSQDAMLRDALTRLKALRQGLGPTVIRPCHEMNGNWFGWSVTAATIANFKKTMKRWRAVQLQVYPEAIWNFSTNGNTSGQSYDWRTLWDDKMDDGVTPVWDVYSVDRYNGYPTIPSYAQFASLSTQVDSYGAPIGVEAHRQFAQSKGVPIGISEWSGMSKFGDFPGWMQAFYDWMVSHRGNGAGNLLWDVLFNQPDDSYDYELYPTTHQPNASAAYQQRMKAGLTQPQPHVA
jgi:hypothetical protein